MTYYSPDFTLEVEGVKGVCPAGEVYAQQTIAERKIPVFSCEGPCIRGEIARLAANLVAHEVPSLARACHAETFLVPHSSMARWVKGAEKTVMIDGCFLKCHGRVLRKLIGEDKVVHIDALPLYKKYTDIFLMDDVPEEERKAVARQVADKITQCFRKKKTFQKLSKPRSRPCGYTMMEEMMKQCCGTEGRPDFEKMKKFMEKCGKMEFGEEEIRMMKECCAQQGMPDMKKMKQLMEKCGCHLPKGTA